MSDDEDMEEYDPEEEEPEEEKDEKETDEEEKEEGEEAEEFIPKPITEDIMKEGLSLLCKTGNGLSHAYVKLEAKDKELTDISLLSSYIHLRYVDLSENRLSDLSPLNNLTHLLWLKLDYNRLQSARMVELPYLQIASFAYNQIIDTEGITHPKLTSLDLKGNNIKKVTGLDPQKLSNLHTLELRGNQLETTLGLDLPKLKSLYLAQNQLKKIEGIENLQQLSTLHLRDNKISELNGFSPEMKLLQYLNLRTSTTVPSEVLVRYWSPHHFFLSLGKTMSLVHPWRKRTHSFLLPWIPGVGSTSSSAFVKGVTRKAEKGRQADLKGITLHLFLFFSAKMVGVSRIEQSVVLTGSRQT
ncbi:leucine-rich repeat-containing protein 23 isoform X1 [Antechinus flavipes]|uniref:leucine-rich repeat-containing protein 23 isoform X1 n=1 Tax=Antechinus flavipes TaxID=38775 RepID=UPI0022366A52|nr:leucine-rich repeat-containing protein 23 isoform X1 [Antechinus flavipes]XP_051819286.1 leucine-rich repeat-containing protein 23 isoform X1 [Antechinus flavipes]XP_051819287.1 leucine-rich repeat-containing protein 23 isoform X1 [Antechinus flavipes]XP_051819288.1 leucine-rich repeat-containing protein 23 isoform X1 [Antechinus flavipes]XP_051819289.1 leucine-rich repeat-containing protein 23 isoform X1 [Antechinus flavipes]